MIWLKIVAYRSAAMDYFLEAEKMWLIKSVLKIDTELRLPPTILNIGNQFLKYNSSISQKSTHLHLLFDVRNHGSYSHP